MKPYYQDEWVTIYHGDCREILPELDVKVDLVLTDPPYGMNLNTDFSGMESRLFKGKTGGNYHNPVIGDSEPFNPQEIMCLIDCDEQLWFGADYYCQRIPNIDKGSWLVWDKRLDASADKMWGSTFELIWSRVPHRRLVLRYKWAGIFGMEHQDTNKRIHPTQKPIELILRLINDYSEGGNVILDPFLGSGTTAYCAKKLNRKCIGIEIEEKYCEIAAKRCSQQVFDFRS